MTETPRTDAWNAAIEFAAGIADDWTLPDHILLHAGEMTAQELRSVMAVARAIAAQIRDESLNTAEGTEP